MNDFSRVQNTPPSPGSARLIFFFKSNIRQGSHIDPSFASKTSVASLFPSLKVTSATIVTFNSWIELFLRDEVQRRCRALCSRQCSSGRSYRDASKYVILIHSSLLLPSHSNSAADDMKTNETEAKGVNRDVNRNEAYVNRIPTRFFRNKNLGMLLPYPSY